MGETRTYQGSCHCGAVKYEVTADLGSLMVCNCSMCGRSGAVMSFVTPDNFRLSSGEQALSDYQFGRKSIHHLFCKTCGVRSFARGQKPDGTQMVMINARCLEGVDAADLPARKHDGRSR